MSEQRPGITASPAATGAGGRRRRLITGGAGPAVSPAWGGVTRLARGRQAPLLTAAPVMAALPVPARTWMRLARTSGALGTRIRRTPSWAVASIASAITWLGR